MERIAILDCFSGISGDMTTGAFLDAGMDFAFLEKELRKLKLKGYQLGKKVVKKGAFRATQFLVDIDDHHHTHHHHHVSYVDILGRIQESRLSEKVKVLSSEIFAHVARVEAHLHRTTVQKVAFHEVGALDSIIDIVSAAICFTEWNIARVYATNIQVGTGVMEGAHGAMPIPAPATLALLKGYPVTHAPIPHELITPTGASFIKTLTQPGVLPPAYVVEKIGYGSGMADFKERANIFRLIIGNTASQQTYEELTMIETTIDDMPPFLYETVFETLRACGAKEVFVTPVMMKKQRPAHQVSVLCDPEREKDIIGHIFQETSTIGVRMYTVRRSVLPREIKTVKTVYGPVRVKVCTLPNGETKAAPEYEDCKFCAQKKNVPVMRVYQAAQGCTLPLRKKT